MEIKYYALASERQPYVKWYNDKDRTLKRLIDKDIEMLKALDFKSDNGLPKSITHLKNQSRTDADHQTERLYTVQVTKENLIYFGVIDDQVVLFTGGHKDNQVRDIAKVREMYLDYIEMKKNPPEPGVQVT